MDDTIFYLKILGICLFLFGCTNIGIAIFLWFDQRHRCDHHVWPAKDCPFCRSGYSKK